MMLLNTGTRLPLRPPKTTQKMFRCELCSVRLPYSEKELSEHMESPSHRHMKILFDNGLWPGKWEGKNVKNQITPQIYHMAESGGILCSVCDVEVGDSSALLVHQMEALHASQIGGRSLQSIIPRILFCQTCGEVLGKCFGLTLEGSRLLGLHFTSSSHRAAVVNPMSSRSGGATSDGASNMRTNCEEPIERLEAMASFLNADFMMGHGLADSKMSLPWIDHDLRRALEAKRALLNEEEAEMNGEQRLRVPEFIVDAKARVEAAINRSEEMSKIRYIKENPGVLELLRVFVDNEKHIRRQRELEERFLGVLPDPRSQDQHSIPRTQTIGSPDFRASHTGTQPQYGPAPPGDTSLVPVMLQRLEETKTGNSFFQNQLPGLDAQCVPTTVVNQVFFNNHVEIQQRHSVECSRSLYLSHGDVGRPESTRTVESASATETSACSTISRLSSAETTEPLLRNLVDVGEEKRVKEEWIRSQSKLDSGPSANRRVVLVHNPRPREHKHKKHKSRRGEGRREKRKGERRHSSSSSSSTPSPPPSSPRKPTPPPPIHSSSQEDILAIQQRDHSQITPPAELLLHRFQAPSFKKHFLDLQFIQFSSTLFLHY